MGVVGGGGERERERQTDRQTDRQRDSQLDPNSKTLTLKDSRIRCI